MKNLRLSNRQFAEPSTDWKSTADEFGFKRGGGEPLYYFEKTLPASTPSLVYGGGYMSASEYSTNDYFAMMINVTALHMNPWTSDVTYYYGLDGSYDAPKNNAFGFRTFSFVAIRPFIHY